MTLYRLTEPVSGTFPLPRAGYIRDRDPVFLRINTHNHSLAGLVCVVTPCSSLSVRLSH